MKQEACSRVKRITNKSDEIISDEMEMELLEGEFCDGNTSLYGNCLVCRGMVLK